MNTKLLEVGIDWLTATCPLGDTRQDEYDAIYRRLSVEYMKHGYVVKPMRRLGYAGETINGLFIGTSPQGTLIQASGTSAEHLAMAFKYAQHTPHLTRIDVQTTVQLEEIHDHAMLQFDKTEDYKALQPKSKRWKAIHIHSANDGCTANIGSRTSPMFIRIYDKSAQSPNSGYPPNSWRFEVELKQELAGRFFQGYLEATNERNYMLGVLTTAAARRGLLIVWPYTFVEIDFAAPRTKTDDEKKLDWLRSHVRSTVSLLIYRGLEYEVIRALGLDGIVDEKYNSDIEGTFE